MSVENQLLQRSGSRCELCASAESLFVYQLPPVSAPGSDDAILVCERCLAQLEKRTEPDAAHWQCLKDCMWSDVPAVQVVSWRLLNRLKNESWANELLDMMYLDDDRLAFAKATGDHLESDGEEFHRDCNGALLQTGDTVTLIKSLDVKGSQVNAKIGTVVKSIRLVPDNTAQIEGKIEGQQIVILTKYVRKSG
jgi:protein PhnA